MKLNKTLKYCILAILLININLFSQNITEQKTKLAETFENNGDFKSSARLYLELLNANPNNDDYLYGYSRALIAQNQYSELLPTIEKYISLRPSNKLYNLYAEVLWKLGKTEEANSAWAKGIDINKNDVNSYKNTAISQSNMMQIKKATETLEKARTQFKNKDMFVDELSRLYTASGDYRKAMEEIFLFFESSGNFPQTQGRLQALTFSGDAKKYILENLENKKNSPNKGYKILYAWFLSAIGEFEKSLALYTEIDNESNAKGAELYNFALARQKDEQYEIALKTFGKIIDYGKSSPYLLNALYGYNRVLESQISLKSFFNSKDYEELIRRYKNIVELFPNNNFSFDAQYRIATIYFKNLNRPEQAIEELNKIITVSGNSPIAYKSYNLLGDIYLYDNDINKAEVFYNKNASVNLAGLENEKNYAIFKIADILYYTGNIDSAAKIYSALAKITDANIANDAIEKSMFIEQNKNSAKAIRDFAIAEKYNFQNKDSLAVLKYDEAAQFGSGDIIEMSILNKAEIFKEAKKYSETIELLKKFTIDFPESINIDKVYFNLGNVYLLNNQPDLAEKTFAMILEKYPRTIYMEQCRNKIRQIRSRINS